MKATPSCSFPGCNRPPKARGLCLPHYKQQRRGSPLHPLRSPNRTPMDRLEGFINKTDSCWLWTGGTNRAGYGLFRLGGSSRLAHRVAYELYVGPIPDGLVIDHLCRTPSCVNPAHLECVTDDENRMRGRNASARAILTGRCINGHPFDKENTYWRPTGGRTCRECGRARWRQWNARRSGR